MLLKVKYLLVILIGFLSIFILCALELLVQPLDLHVQVLLLVAQLVEFLLGVLAAADFGAELGVGEVAELVVQVFEGVDEIVLVLLDFLLVTINVWVVL